jgi:glucose uptake protein GlcU
MLLTGFAAVILIVVGVFFIAYKQKKAEPGFVPEKVIRPKVSMLYIVAIFAIGTIGYLGYFALGELPGFLFKHGNIVLPPQIDPQNHATVYGFTQFFPQALGMVIVALAFAVFMWLRPCFGKHRVSFTQANKNNPFAQHQSYFNMVDGIVFSAAALTILLSKAHNGTATATSLSQTNIIIATLGGLFILKEHKPRKEFASILIGLGLVTTGGIVIGLLSTFFPG